MDALHFYTDHPFVDCLSCIILNIFEKGSVFGLDDYQFSECRFTQISCAKG